MVQSQSQVIRRVLVAVLAVLASVSFGAPFTPGNLVVLRVGDGSAALGSAATACFLDEYTPSGTLVQSVAMPTVTSGSNRKFTLSATASSEGAMVRSTNGLLLTCFGYDASPTTTAIVASTSATINRVVAAINGSASIDTTTALTDAMSTSNPRGAVSTNGASFWITGNGTSASGGTRYATLGATTSTQVASTPTNLRTTNIFAGQLYMSSATTGVYSVGTGLPTTTGNTATLLSGFPGSMTSISSFYFLNATTLYVVDDGGGTVGGIYKWTLSGGSWTGNQFTDTATKNVRGICGTQNSSGQTVLYFTTAETGQPGRIRKIVDNGSFSNTSSIVVTGPTNTGFRGVAFAPVAPTAINDSYSTNPNQTLTVNSPGVLSNDSGPGDPGFGFTAVLDSTVPAGHSLTLNPNGSFTYIPQSGFSGQVTFTYHTTDGFASSAPATVTITVPNTAPTLNAISSPKNVNEQTLLTFTATASDPDTGQTLTFSLDGGAPAGASITTGGVFTWTPTEAQGPGSYSVIVRVTDNGSPTLSASQLVQINVAEVNTAPVLSGVPSSLTVDELTPATFTASASDSDLPANTVTFSLAGAPAGASINPATGLFSWTPTESQGPGDYTFSVVATDNGSPVMSDSKSITIHVNEVNQAPSLTSPGNQTVAEGSNLSFTLSASDGDLPAQTLTFSISSGAQAGMTLNPSTGAFSWTPSEAQGPGTYSVTFRVTDNGSPNLFDQKTITIHVDEVNAAPVLDPVGDKTVDAGSNLSFTLTASDSDIPAQTLTFSATGLPTGATLDSNSGAFSWTPTGADAGDHPVTFSVSDGSLSDDETINIHVNGGNQPPVLDPIGDKAVDEGFLLTFTVTASDPDLPAQTLTFSVTGLPSGATFDTGTGAFSWTPSEAQGPSDYPLTFSVSDGSLSDDEAINIHVNEVNIAPTLNPIGNKSVDEGSTLTFAISGSDPDMPAQTLSFSASGLPTGATFDSVTHTFAWTPTEAQGPGDYEVTFSVSDGGLNDSASETITIHVNEVNVAPVLNPIGNKTVGELTNLTFTVSGSDSDLPAQTLTFEAGGLPTGATFDEDTKTFSWTPTEAQGPGDYQVTFEVSDGQMDDYETITIHVNEVNVAPVLNPIGNKTVDELTNLTFTVSGSDTDLPAQTLTFEAGGLPTGATFDEDTKTFSWTPTEAQGPGDYHVTFEVSDGQMDDYETITIHVNEVNVAPVLNPIGNKTVDELTNLTFTVSGSDSDLPAQTLTFEAGGLPTGATFDEDTKTFSWTPTEAQGPGDYQVTFEVSDGQMDDYETITIHVNEVNVAPVLNPIGNKTVDELTNLTFTVSGSDSDLPAQTLTFEAGGLPTGASFDEDTKTFSWTPTEAQGPGDYQVTFEVSDGQMDDYETITIHVNEVNVAPVLDPIGDKDVDETQTLTFTVSASDLDLPAQTLTFSATGVPSGATFDAQTQTFTWTPGYGTAGDYPVTFEVSDGALSDSETITIHVHEVVLTILPDTMSLFRGYLHAGDLSKVFSSDNDDLVLKPGPVASSAEAPIQLIAEGQSPIQTPTELKLVVETHGNQVNLLQKVEVYNFLADSWVILEQGALTQSDTSLTLSIPNPEQYVSTGGRVRMKLSFRQSGPVGFWPWLSFIDELTWRVKG